MPALKYVGPFDEIEVTGHVVKRGDTFDVDVNDALSLIAQPANFEPADKSAKTIVSSLSKEELAAHTGKPFEPPAEAPAPEAPPTVPPVDVTPIENTEA